MADPSEHEVCVLRMEERTTDANASRRNSTRRRIDPSGLDACVCVLRWEEGGMGGGAESDRAAAGWYGRPRHALRVSY
eukprot:3515501-Rhodomonas_salina.1